MYHMIMIQRHKLGVGVHTVGVHSTCIYSASYSCLHLWTSDEIRPPALLLHDCICYCRLSVRRRIRIKPAM